MQEKSINIDNQHPVALLGANNVHIDYLRSLYPDLRIIARGREILLKGEATEIKIIEEIFAAMQAHLQRYQRLTTADVQRFAAGEKDYVPAQSTEDFIILYGTGGEPIKARTPNQQKMVDELRQNDMLFAVGPAGTGKTYTAVALAVKALKNKEVRRIILTRPAVEAGENLGFLPGDLKEKLDPYLQPLYDALGDMLPPEKLSGYLEKGVIQIAPLAFMRGRTLDNAFAILDEAQNATRNQLKMFLTRMGRSAKFVITGDITQIDLPRHQQSGLEHAVALLSNVPGIAFVSLGAKDIIRHRLVSEIIERYEKDNNA
ncbi:MAG: PhoH family protein [Flavobacteriales bacterium]|nr:PhoH family protein [Flavobacteriales bacterium]